MIGILAATRREARDFIKSFIPDKKNGIFHYRGSISGKNAALFLTRPGVGSKEQLRRFLRLYGFDAVISTGAAANLTSALTHLEAVNISEVVAVGQKNLILKAPPYNSAVRAVSVPHLVVTDAEKSMLRADTGADILDMELYTIAAIMAEKEFSRIFFQANRIVDDLPGEENYLMKEKILREMTLRIPGGKRPSFRDIWRFGIWDFLRITLRRRRVAQTIFRAVQKIIAGQPQF